MRQANFWLTTRCNMKCVYCYEKNLNLIDMKREVIDKSIIFLRKYMEGSFFVNIHGGEPCLAYSNLEYLINQFEKISKIDKKNIYYSMTTNGTLSENDKIIDIIKKYNIDISVSIDGKSYTQNKNRKLKNSSDSFIVVDKFIDKLLDNDINPRIRMTYNACNVDELFENILFFYKKGIKFVVAHHNSLDNWNINDVEKIKKQTIKIKDFFLEKNIHINMIEPINNRFIGKCDCGKNEINIYVNGDIYPCTWHTGDSIHKIGNVYYGIDTKKRNELIKISDNENKDCIGCSIYELCENTRCKFINKSKTGNYNVVKPIDCHLKNIRFECIGVVGNE